MATDASQSIGRVKGPGPRPHSFTFVAYNSVRTLRTGEFVSFVLPIDGARQNVLARVVEGRPLRSFPDSFLLSPTLQPGQIADTVGYSCKNNLQFEFVADIIGYYDRDLEDFVNPRVQPPIGRVVKLTSNKLLSTLLTRVQPGQVGAATVGWLLSRSAGEVPVVLDVAALVSTHLSIISSTGAGKSYLAGVIIEELLSPHNRAAVLIIDPHGEYGTLAELTDQSQMASEAYQPEVAVHKPGDLKVQIGSLSLADLRYLLPNLSDRMEYVLGLVYRKVRGRNRQQAYRATDDWTLSDLQQAIAAIGQDPSLVNNAKNSGSSKGTSYRETANALLWRLNSVFEDTILFDERAKIQLRNLVRPGKCTVLQLNGIHQRQQQVLLSALLRQIHRARMLTSKGKVTPNNPLFLPYPVFILIEEAHHFAPANGDAVSGGILKQILGEGRKFGVGVGLISQRPGKLDSDVLSQCNTQCLLRIINPYDQTKVRESIETVGQDLLRELPDLSKGQAIIAGAAVNTPVLCQVRPRYTTHTAESISAPHVWLKYPETII